MSSSLVNITSKGQFDSLLSSSTIVVTDFYADWCGPCRVIAPLYEQLANQLSRPNRITFTKVNVDQQKEIAQAYRVSAMPTFIIFKNARPISTILGADRQRLSEAVKKLAAEANAIESDGGDSGEASSGRHWIGGAVPQTYSDVTDQVIVKNIELLNRDTEKGGAQVLFDTSKPASLANSKGKEESDTENNVDWVESDTDDQLMLFVPFNSTLKIHSLHITSLPPSSDDDVMRPKTLHLYTNRPHNLGFDEADSTDPEQIITLKPEDWDSATGTATVETRMVKFQRVTSLVIFVVNGEGDGEKTRIDRLRIIGEAGEKREMGKLEKIGDEPGE